MLVLLLPFLLGLNEYAYGLPTAVDLSEFTRGKHQEISLPTPGRVQVINGLEDSVYGDPAPPISLEMSCSHTVTLVQGTSKVQGTHFRMRVWSAAHNGQKTEIQAPVTASVQCVLRGEGFDIALKSEALLYPEVAELRKRKYECLPVVRKTGCQWSDGNVTGTSILKDPEQAFGERFRMLMGYSLSHQEFVEKDPSMALDFSRAPKLDLIVVDILQILKDFVGVLTLRMLEWHASHGTRIYFMTSRALLLPRETAWLFGFMKNNPNIHFSLYSSNDQRESPHSTPSGLGEFLNSAHRNNHIKVFLALSASDPKANAFIAGGRNISEMYFFESQPDNSRFPEIIQWGERPYSWIYFDDLEFKVTGREITQQMARVMLGYNEQRILPQPTPANEWVEASELKPGFFIEMPFDESAGQLEKAYIALIDRAQKSLQLVSPYLNLTPDLERAFLRARDRGVDIHFVTNLNVLGDFMPAFLQPAMLRELRREIGKFKISYYQRPEHILHVKALLMDSKYLVLGSVNLNQRSFRHDTEISILFDDPQLIKEYDEQIRESVMPWVSPLQRSDLPPKTIMEFLIRPLMGFM